MATYNDTVAFSGNLKRVYGDIVNLVPDNAFIQKMVGFKTMQKTGGESYNIGVVLQPDQGFTYAGPDAGVFSFADPIAAVVRQATIKSNQIVGQSVVAWELVSRAMKGGDAAFKGALDEVMGSFIVSMRNRLEIGLLYGGSGIGVVGAVSGSTVTIAESEWAAGIWACLQGAKVDIYVGTTNTSRVTGASITKINVNTREITLSDATAVAANDVIYLAGAKGNEALGVHSIITASGSLFGIDTSSYGLWGGNTYGVGGNLTQTKLDDAATVSMDKGAPMADRVLLVNPRVWSDLLSEQVARRQFTADASQMVNGANSLKFRSQNGNLEVISSNMVKQGYGYILSRDDFRRVGTNEVALGDPANKDSVVRTLPNSAGYQILAYSNQALFCRRPGFQTVLTGITLAS